MNLQEFLVQFFLFARQDGYAIETSYYNGREQVDFGNKKLHAGHLEQIFPEILDPEANISQLIERVAPGRPCAHRPTREIIQRIVAMTARR